MKISKINKIQKLQLLSKQIIKQSFKATKNFLHHERIGIEKFVVGKEKKV
jgi:hypothetical protein